MNARAFACLAPFALAAAVLVPSSAAATVDGRIVFFGSSPNPSALNQQVTIHADINWEDVKPSGTMTYYSNGTVIPGCENMPFESNGAGGFCHTAFNAPGDYQLTVSYTGDGRYPPGTAGPITQHVDSSTRYYSDLSGGDFVDDAHVAHTFVNVRGGTEYATGMVDFYDGILVRCADVPLQPNQDSATAHCDYPASKGQHHLTFVYKGDALYRPGTSTWQMGVAGYKRYLDFDGDNGEDTVVRGDNGDIQVWYMDRIVVKSTATVFTGTTSADIIKAADFNADGITDFVRQYPDGSATLSLTNGTPTLLRGAGSGWQLTHLADFNGDGKADMLWRRADGSVEMWLMDGATVLQQVTIMPAGPWRVQLVGDFNGDLRNDLVWRNDADGSVGLWLMDGTTVLERKSLMPAGTAWTPTHVADLNFDGMADLLWRNADGTVGAWLLNGTTVVDHRTLMGPGTGWSVAMVAQLHSDSPAASDLVWVHDDGSVGAWLMNGLDVVTRKPLMGAGTGWKLVAISEMRAENTYLTWANTNRSVGMWDLDNMTVVWRETKLPPGSPYTVITEDVKTNVAP